MKRYQVSTEFCKLQRWLHLGRSSHSLMIMCQLAVKSIGRWLERNIWRGSGSFVKEQLKGKENIGGEKKKRISDHTGRRKAEFTSLNHYCHSFYQYIWMLLVITKSPAKSTLTSARVCVCKMRWIGISKRSSTLEAHGTRESIFTKATNSQPPHRDTN